MEEGQRHNPPHIRISHIEGVEKVMLKDQVAIVTGGGSGIGRESARLFAKEGAKVVVADINSSTAEGTVQLIKNLGGEAIAVPTNVCVTADIKNMINTAVEKYGRLTILFNNAGGGRYARDASVTEISEEAWDKSINLHLRSVFLGCKYAIREMIKAGGGVILSTASILGFVAMPELPAYCAAKAGVIALTRQIALDYARHNIRANAICPGWIHTQTMEEALATSPDPVRTREEVIKSLPLGRFATAEEAANVALFLVSNQSSFVTGATVTVDGGYTIR